MTKIENLVNDKNLEKKKEQEENIEQEIKFNKMNDELIKL